MKQPAEGMELVKGRRLNNPDLKCDHCGTPIPLGDYAIEITSGDTVVATVCSVECNDEWKSTY